MTVVTPDNAAEIVREVPRTQDKVASRLAALDHQLPADPWARWLLLALHRHEARQAWVGEVVRDRLGGDLLRIGTLGGFRRTKSTGQDETWGNPNQPNHREDNTVPGLLTWTYRFHGIGCRLTHESGETLDVDFVGGSTDWIDPFFFQYYLESVAETPKSERGLPCIGSFESAWMTDLETMRTEGWITGDHKVCLTAPWRALAHMLAAPTEQSPLAAAWHACVIGRIDVAFEYLESTDPPLALAQRRDVFIRDRAATLEQRIDVGDARPALLALGALGQRFAESALRRQLSREPLDGVVSAALELIGEWGGESFRDALIDTMARARGRDVPIPYIRTRCAALLLGAAPPGDEVTAHERCALLEALVQTGHSSEGEHGLLLYVLDEEAGLERLHQALTSTIPMVRQEAASALGIVGTPEALAILRSVECVEAQTVLALLRGAPPINGPVPVGELLERDGETHRVYSIAELNAADAGESTVWAFEEMQKRYAPLLRKWFAS